MNEKNDNKTNQEYDYLNQFLNNQNTTNDEIKNLREDVKKQSELYQDNSYKPLQYMNVPIESLPLSSFYKPGTKIKIRSAEVGEIQAYSLVDDENYIDVTEKLNQILKSCVKFYHPDGREGSYKDLRDGDRLFIIFMIRELTFQKGNSFAKDVKCDSCGHDFKIYYRATTNQQHEKSFVFYDMPEKLNKFYNSENNHYQITINDKKWKIAPPTIGIQEIFFSYIKEEHKAKRTPNLSFMKIYSHLLWDKSYISEDGFKAKLDEFKNFDMNTFQTLNKFVLNMTFGIKELKSNCTKCGQEVHTDISFPEGASSIFLVSDSFDEFDQ